MASRYSLKNIAERRAIAAAVVEPYLQAKRDHTVLTFYKRVKPGSNGRVHTVLAPRTASWRLSSSSSPSEEASTNLQNQPKKVARMDPLYQVRDVFVADGYPDYVLLAGDYKNAEAILVAAYSRDYAMLDMIMGGGDIHKYHAQLFFDAEEITKFQRDLAKQITYGSFYMASPPTIHRLMLRDADTTGVHASLSEVRNYHRILLSVRRLPIWWKEVQREIRRTGGVIRNCFGYRRVLHDPEEHNRLKDALSFLPQSTVAANMNRSIVRVFDELDDGRRVMILHQNHDELLFWCHKDEVERVARETSRIMERPFEIHGHKLHIPVDWSFGQRWGQLKELKLAV